MAKAQSARTHCPKGHPYDAENTRHTSAGSRECRACRAEQYRSRRRPRPSEEERVTQHICRDVSGCWRWIGAINAEGYDTLHRDLAHRIVYELLVELIPAGLTLDHLCRNRSCVNPGHLEPVPLAINVLRGESPPARNARKTH